MGVRQWLTLVFTLRGWKSFFTPGFEDWSFSQCDGSLLGQLLLNVLQEFIIGWSRLRPILHQVLEERRFSWSFIPAGGENRRQEEMKREQWSVCWILYKAGCCYQINKHLKCNHCFHVGCDAVLHNLCMCILSAWERSGCTNFHYAWEEKNSLVCLSLNPIKIILGWMQSLCPCKITSGAPFFVPCEEASWH